MQLDGQVLHLTDKECKILHYLTEQRDRTVARVELIDSLWTNAEQALNERTIDVHIRRLHTKLDRLSGTVRGQGYSFYAHPEVTVWTAPEYSI